MLVYIITAFGALWGILTLIGIREEDKYIQELFQAAQEANRKKTTHLSHGSE
jgi:protein-S-isoprenylcysteine O-methyltransferase Ste14